jgi:hypothetical protein
MNILTKIIVVLIVLLTLLVFFPYPHTTGPTEVGVRTVKWSPFLKRGVEDFVRDPGGTYFFSPIFNDWHTFVHACKTSK